MKWYDGLSIEPLSEESKTTLDDGALVGISLPGHTGSPKPGRPIQNLQLEPTDDYHEVRHEAISTAGGHTGTYGGRNNTKKKGGTFQTKLRTESTLHSCQTQTQIRSRGTASSPTLLLVGIIYYQKEELGRGLHTAHTHIKVWAKPKIVALCLTGKKYRGGKVTKKKRKATDNIKPVKGHSTKVCNKILHSFTCETAHDQLALQPD